MNTDKIKGFLAAEVDNQSLFNILCKIIDRYEFGLKKYGKPIKGAYKDPGELAKQAQEENMDALFYNEEILSFDYVDLEEEKNT